MLTLGFVLLLFGYAFLYNGFAKWRNTDGNSPSLGESLGLPATPPTMLQKNLGSSFDVPPTGGNQTGQPPSSVAPPPGGIFI